MLHPSQVSLAWAGGESPALSGSLPPGIVIFDTLYVIHKFYRSYWLVFEVTCMVHH